MTSTANMHVGLAEQAKLHHLAGHNTRALLYLREAMQRSSREGKHALLSRYYSQLSLEILEQEGHYEEVIEYCQRAIEHYQSEPPRSALARKDLAEIWQRRGVCELRRKAPEAAATALREALAISDTTLPLSSRLLDWIERRYQISDHQLQGLLSQQKYYSIRKDTIDSSRAVKLPQLEAITL